MMSPAVTVGALLLWGTLVALDLVSVPQAMIARPLVAGTVAGLLSGDLVSGFHVAVVMELFALDVLPVGASRYPDYGPATVGAAFFVARHGAWQESLGLGVALALVVASIGGWSLGKLRHLIAKAIQRAEPGLVAGDPAVIRRLQLRSIGRDALRGVLLTALALGLALAMDRWVRLDTGTEALLSVVAIGSAVAAMVGGAIRSAGRGARMRWLAAGGGLGLLLVWFT